MELDLKLTRIVHNRYDRILAKHGHVELLQQQLTEALEADVDIKDDTVYCKGEAIGHIEQHFIQEAHCSKFVTSFVSHKVINDLPVIND
jgi:hypothetical protein